MVFVQAVKNDLQLLKAIRPEMHRIGNHERGILDETD